MPMMKKGKMMLYKGGLTYKAAMRKTASLKNRGYKAYSRKAQVGYNVYVSRMKYKMGKGSKYK